MSERQFYEVNPDEVVWVLPTTTTGACALWEKNPAHPGGETFIAGEYPQRAALTPKVVALIDARAVRVLSKVEADAALEALKERQIAATVETRRQKREAKRSLFIRAVGTDRGFDDLVPAV